MSGRLALLHPHGYMSMTDPDGKILEADTLQCVHCQAHWRVEPGSGKKRGFCMRCNGPICGPKCAVCVPSQQQLSNLEAGRAIDFRPIIVGGFHPRDR